MRLPVYERREGIAPMSIPQVQPMPQIGDNGESAVKNIHGIFAKIQEIQNGMEDARTLELFNKFKMDSQEYHENPDRGIYNTRLGYQSYGIYKEADEWLRRKGEDYARELPSRRAQANFRKMAREHIMQRGLQNSRFEADQVRKYERETADASIKNSINEVANNPYDDRTALQAEKDILQALELKLRFSSSEERKSAVADMKNDIAAARLAPMIKDNPLKAKEWFHEHSEELNPQTRLKFKEAIKNETQIYEVQTAVDELIQKYPQGHEQEALKFIRENYSGELEERIASAYKTRANELAIDLNKQDRLLRLAQDKLEERILDNFYLNDVMPSDAEFRTLVSSGQLRAEQVERLQAKVDYSVMRSRIEKRILGDNPGLTRMELDVAVMNRMGTIQEEYTAAFNAAVQAVLNNEMDNNGLEYLYQRGRLTRQDINNIKRYVQGLDEIQKNYYKSELRDLDNAKGTTINSLVEAGLPEDLVEGIKNRFIAEANMLNPKDKNYREQLLNAKKKILLDAMDSIGKRTDGLLWGQTEWGELRSGIQDITLKNRNIDPFPTLPELKPSNITLAQAAASSGSSDNPVLGMVQGYTIPKGGRFTSFRQRKNGPGTHSGIDLSAGAGTDVKMTDFLTQLTVKKVRTDAPSTGLGNYVVLSGTYPDGTTIEVSLGHMQNNSINVTEGQILNIGDIIGKVGNTGETSDREKGGITNWYEGKNSGYHLDVKIKINGRLIDPEKFNPRQFIPQEQNTPQEPAAKTSLDDFFGIPGNIPKQGDL